MLLFIIGQEENNLNLLQSGENLEGPCSGDACYYQSGGVHYMMAIPL